MAEFLKILLFLNLQGSVLVILLLLLKKVIQKAFSGRVQRNLWILAAVVFLIPVWKVVPEKTVAPTILPYYSENTFTYEIEDALKGADEENIIPSNDMVTEKIDFYSIILSVWCLGAGLFLLLNVVGYIAFLLRERNDSNCITDDKFSSMLISMGIKRKIRLRECEDVDSPMLTGVLFPVVYMPEKSLTDDELRYVYSHELMHYKHKDLPVKWFVCIINAINWFNPCMYFVMKNLNEACEIYCDEAVTKNMDDYGKREYMNTILNLVAKEGENYV